MDTLITDGGPPYDSHKFKQYMEEKGIRHHICTPENKQVNRFVESFQKVLINIVHTAISEKEDPKETLEKYLINYRAALYKTIGKSLHEMMFRGKMKTKLPCIRTRKRKPQQEQDMMKRKSSKRKGTTRNIEQKTKIYKKEPQ